MAEKGNEDALLEVTQRLLLEDDLVLGTTSSGVVSFDSISAVSRDGSELIQEGSGEICVPDDTDTLENSEGDGGPRAQQPLGKPTAVSVPPGRRYSTARA